MVVIPIHNLFCNTGGTSILRVICIGKHSRPAVPNLTITEYKITRCRFLCIFEYTCAKTQIIIRNIAFSQSAIVFNVYKYFFNLFLDNIFLFR